MYCHPVLVSRIENVRERLCSGIMGTATTKPESDESILSYIGIGAYITNDRRIGLLRCCCT